MKLRAGIDGLDVELIFTGKHGTQRRTHICTDMQDRTINVPASGDITAADARQLVRAILLAVDSVEGLLKIEMPSIAHGAIDK